ncbi:MAG TPA: cytochrome c [Acidimicrobiia bacterium]|nr:cytochrome c [Acidimicrobiia bacterium]
MNGRQVLRSLIPFVVVVLVSGCSRTSAPVSTVLDLAGGAPPPPPIDWELAAAGESLYLQQCAACHGADLRGAPDWKTPNDDGSYPPPPHDSSGHSWHHSDATLTDLILNGSGFEQSRMPEFAGRLSGDDVRAILQYLKSEWGEQERTFQWQITWQETPRG